MDTIALADHVSTRPRRPHADAGIVFGSAASAPAKKPDSVRATCEAIGLARSTYYYQSHRSAAAIELEQQIVLRLHELRELRPNDGYRRMTLQLQAEGFHVNRKRIARLMQLHGLTKPPSRPTGVGVRSFQPRTPIANLRDGARLTGPYQVWVTDLAYARIQSSLVYASAVIDAWSREVVGYAASLQVTNRLTRIALHSAVRSHRPAPGCIHHSTCGTQYLTHSYCELLRQYGLIPSVGEPAGRAATASRSPRQIVDVQQFHSWKDVIQHPREFIQELYAAGRIDYILGQRAVEGAARLAVAN
ncbi:MAG TPA: IS3 family transposase [Steroidobacteraceae bacterium]|nr:IS3 family transposase [Steroidobacteraceae bacterium]